MCYTNRDHNDCEALRRMEVSKYYIDVALVLILCYKLAHTCSLPEYDFKT